MTYNYNITLTPYMQIVVKNLLTIQNKTNSNSNYKNTKSNKTKIEEKHPNKTIILHSN